MDHQNSGSLLWEDGLQPFGEHWSLKIEYLCTPLAKDLTPECPREESFLVWSGDRQQAVLTIAHCPFPGEDELQRG